MADEQAKARGSWRTVFTGNVLAMGLVSLFTDFSSEMMNPLLPLFIAGLAPAGAAALWVGLSEGVAEATASLLKLVSGGLSDRLGRRKALVLAGYGISSAARPFLALAGAAWHVVALKFADRVGKGVRTAPRDALIGDSVDAGRRGLAFSFHRAMDHAGAVLGPLAAVLVLWLLLGRFGWGGAAGAAPDAAEMRALRVLFAFAVLPGLAAMAVLAFRVREIAPPPAAPAAAGPRAAAWRGLPRRFRAFAGIAAVFALGNSSDLFLLLYARERFGFSLFAVVGLWVALHLSKIAFSLPGGLLSDRFGRRPVILAGWGLYALVYLGMAVVSDAAHFWALFLAYGAYYGLTEGVEKALVADLVPPERRGAAFGLYHGLVGLAALPASLVFGVFWTAIGPAAAFRLGAAFAGAAAVLFTVFLSTDRRPAATRG